MRGLILTLLLSTMAAGAEPAGLMLNGTAATVGKSLITVQDAYFYRALQRVRDGNTNLLAVETGGELKRTVQKMIFEEMVFSEMKSFKFEGDSRAQAQQILRQFKPKGKANVLKQALGAWGKTEAVAVERLSKTLDVERFIQKKVETLTPIVTDADIEKYYKQNQTKLGTDFEAVKSSILMLLKKERMQKGLEEWVRSLKEKYGVTTYVG